MILYLLDGKDRGELVPDYSKQDKKEHDLKNDGVIHYLNKKLIDLTKKKENLETKLGVILEKYPYFFDEDAEIGIDEVQNELAEKAKYLEKAKQTKERDMKKIIELTKSVEQEKFELNNYNKLLLQYTADVNRLKFIEVGEQAYSEVKPLNICPFCGNEIKQNEKRISYAKAATQELETLMNKISSLKEVIEETKISINKNSRLLDTYISDKCRVNDKINNNLKPQINENAKILEAYRTKEHLEGEYKLLVSMLNDLNVDIQISRKQQNTPAPVDYNINEQLINAGWNELSSEFDKMVKACNYPNKPDSLILLSTYDARIGNKHKRQEGKGYRAFINTLMLFNLMKYLEQHGKYNLGMFFVDSPILSLKEKDKITEEERATPEMRKSLFEYLINNCGDNQIVIAENEIPDGLDLSNANVIEFTLDENRGRYGFLESERN